VLLGSAVWILGDQVSSFRVSFSSHRPSLIPRSSFLCSLRFKGQRSRSLHRQHKWILPRDLRQRIRMWKCFRENMREAGDACLLQGEFGRRHAQSRGREPSWSQQLLHRCVLRSSEALQSGWRLIDGRTSTTRRDFSLTRPLLLPSFLIFLFFRVHRLRSNHLHHSLQVRRPSLFQLLLLQLDDNSLFLLLAALSLGLGSSSKGVWRSELRRNECSAAWASCLGYDGSPLARKGDEVVEREGDAARKLELRSRLLLF